MKVSRLQPREVFSAFERIAAIPRGSGNMKEICSFFLDLAEKHGLESFQDEVGNVMIFLPGTEGYEESEPIILQAHLDMVCDQDSNCSLDMTKDPLELETDGKFLWADGTTLGGDDGIALAYIIAIIESDQIAHPPIEALLTVNEEIGMVGSRNLDPSHLKGKRLINLDSEMEGILTTSCAGGVRCKIHVPFSRDKEVKYPDLVYELRVYGLKGGHSGTDIDKNRINALKLLAKIILEMEKKASFSVADIYGGVKFNAIPNEASAVLCFENKKDFLKICEELEEQIANLKARITEDIGGLRVQFMPLDYVEKTSDRKDTIKLIELIGEVPNGVWKMSKTYPELVESSLNLGIIESTESGIDIKFFIRSNVDKEKEHLKKHLEVYVEKYGASIEYFANYSAWEYKEHSPLRDSLIESYKECYGEAPIVSSVHGGLECGILSTQKLPETDFISFGPTMYDVHTPRERLDVESAKRCWIYLKKALKNLK